MGAIFAGGVHDYLNQTLAMIVLWTSATYLFKMEKGRTVWLIAAIPATFMSAVTFTYILQAKEDSS